jgi:2-haloacid dehalogenase
MNTENETRLRPVMMSFDVFGTLISVRDSSYAAFEQILSEAGGAHVDVRRFWERWEHRNIEHYWEPYQPYRQICETSLAETFAEFNLQASGRLIDRYFEAFPKFFLYDDVLPTLERLAKTYKLALVSNIDDDLLAATPLCREFDLVCTAQRARGYKPDGTLFKYLLEQSGLRTAQLFHSGQSQFTDLVGGKPLGLTIAWINRRNIALSEAVPAPDYVLPDIQSLDRIVQM